MSADARRDDYLNGGHEDARAAELLEPRLRERIQRMGRKVTDAEAHEEVQKIIAEMQTEHGWAIQELSRLVGERQRSKRN